VQCYHCRHRFEVGGRAQSTSCPGCHKPLFVGDIVVKKLQPVQEVRTCGRIIVQRKGRIIAKLVEGHLGIECEGVIDAKEVLTGGTLELGPKSSFKGGQTHARNWVMKQGAKVQPSYMNVPDDPKGLDDLVPP